MSAFGSSRMWLSALYAMIASLSQQNECPACGKLLTCLDTYQNGKVAKITINIVLSSLHIFPSSVDEISWI